MPWIGGTHEGWKILLQVKVITSYILNPKHRRKKIQNGEKQLEGEKFWFSVTGQMDQLNLRVES